MGVSSSNHCLSGVTEWSHRTAQVRDALLPAYLRRSHNGARVPDFYWSQQFLFLESTIFAAGTN